MYTQTEMTLPELMKALDYAIEHKQKLHPDVYNALETFILSRTEDDQFRQMLMDRLIMLQ